MIKYFLLLTILSGFTTTASAQLHLYWSSSASNNIQRANLNGDNQEIAVDLQNTPRGLAIDYERGRLYFANGEHNSITSVTLNGSEAYSIVSVTKPIDIALDKAKQELYYTDITSQTISKIKTDGSENEIIISSLPSPGFLDIDYLTQKIYFTSQENSASKIYTAKFDGSDIKVLISSPYIISGIAVDGINQKIYWLERGNDLLNRSNIDGSNTKTICDAGKTSIALEIDDINGFLYWASKETNQIIKSNLSGSEISVFLDNIVGIGGIAVDIKNGCSRVETIYDTIAVTDTLYIDVDLTDIIGVSKTNIIKLYPNPTHEILQINSGLSYSVIKDYSIKISSPTGAEIFRNKFNSQNFSINLSKFGNNGLFLVSILDENNNLILTKKIVLH